MVYLSDMRDWLKTFGIGEHFYIGKLDVKQKKSIGVYQRDNKTPMKMALGGIDNTKHDKKEISILVHWTENANETERKAIELFEKLRAVNDVTIGESHIPFLILQVPEPVDVGTDEKGIYERVIWLDIYYER